jgi:hypothetical protein
VAKLARVRVQDFGGIGFRAYALEAVGLESRGQDVDAMIQGIGYRV